MSLNGPAPEGGFEVDLSYSGGTEGTHFDAPFSFTIDGGETEGSVQFTARNNDRIEPARVVTVEVPVAGQFPDVSDPQVISRTITIQDDDAALPTVSIVAVGGPTTEGEDSLFVLTRTGGDLSQELSVDIELVGAVGFRAPGNAVTVVIPATEIAQKSFSWRPSTMRSSNGTAF